MSSANEATKSAVSSESHATEEVGRDGISAKIILYQFDRPAHPEHGPNLSPFCLKLETFLRMANIPYTARAALPKEGPKHKVPFLDIDGEKVADSDTCIKRLSERFGVFLDEGISKEKWAVGHSVKQMLEEGTFWTIVYRRWVEKFEDTPGLFKASVTLPVRIYFRWMLPTVKGWLDAQGMGRHTPEEVARFAEKDLRAVSTILGENKFILGNTPSSIDATVFGSVSIFLWVLAESAQEKLIKTELKNLEEYCWRMRDLYWKDWATISVKSTS